MLASSTLFLRSRVTLHRTIFRENMAFGFDVLKPIRAGIAGVYEATKVRFFTGGGAISIRGYTDLHIGQANQIVDNHAATVGGGIKLHNYNGQPMLMINTQSSLSFTGNSAKLAGGAMSIIECDLNVISLGISFYNNSANRCSPDIFHYGGKVSRAQFYACPHGYTSEGPVEMQYR